MKKDEVLAAVYQTPTPAEEATTFATAEEMTNLGLNAWVLILKCFEPVHGSSCFDFWGYFCEHCPGPIPSTGCLQDVLMFLLDC